MEYETRALCVHAYGSGKPAWPDLNTFHTHLVLFESLEELDDVRRGADVDEEKLGQLVVGELALGEQPASQDKKEQQDLLQGSNPLVWGQLDVDFQLGRSMKKETVNCDESFLGMKLQYILEFWHTSQNGIS